MEITLFMLTSAEQINRGRQMPSDNSIHYGWTDYNDLNQFSIGFPTFWRDYDRLPNVATEHTMYSSIDKLWAYAATTRGLTNVDKERKFLGYRILFLINLPMMLQLLKDRPASQSIWNFGLRTATIIMLTGHIIQKQIYTKEQMAANRIMDKDTGKQLTAKNVVVLGNG